MCNREAASVEAAARRLADEVHVIGVATTGSGRDYAEFVERHGVTFPSFDDTFGVVFDSFGIPSTPAMVAIALDGTTEAVFGAADDTIIDLLVSSARS